MKSFQSHCITFVLSVIFIVTTTGCQPTPAVGPTASQVPTTLTSPIVAIPSAPIPLSGEWRFSVDKDKAGEQQGWAEPTYDDSAWVTVTVPHTWNVMPDYSNYDGLAWYRRAFTIPAASRNAHLRLRFEAVFYLARVWLNGQYLGEHEGGYTPFEFDISSIARPGGGNVLAVQVDNRRAADRIPANLGPGWTYDWWNHGGIIRDVSLKITSKAYIARQQIVSVPHITGMDEANLASVTATLTVHNTSGQTLDGTLQANLLDDVDGQPVLEAPVSAPVSVPSGGSADVQIAATLVSPKLWHFDHPNLYRWSASLLTADGQVLDTSEVTIGIRSVELKDGRFYLNGEPVRLVGVARHADYPGLGSAETMTAMAADYDDLKTLNEVFTRPVHYPQAEFILDYADRHGILLIPEVPAWQLTQQQLSSQHMRDLEKQQLGEMIAEDFNHPSVWAWSVGNEFASDTSSGHDFVREMIAYVKSLDPTRPVGFVSNKLGSQPQSDATALSDFVMMNQYFGTWHGTKQDLSLALDRIHQTWPDKTVIISEFGFAPHWNNFGGPSTSSLNPDQYYFIPDDTPSDSEAADAVRRQLIHDQMPILRSKPFVAGAIFWSYQDYRTPTNFKTGLVDAERNKRGSWEVLRDQYAPALIDSVTLSPVADGQRTSTVALHTRGPVDVDMPAYTLRAYSLHWAMTSPDGGSTFSEGDVSLPILAPGTQWSGEIPLTVPSEDYILTLSVVRPTGFSVTDHSYDAQGELVPSDGGVQMPDPSNHIMNNRTRALAVLNYEPYDRLPLVHFGFWTETLDKWASEGYVTFEEAKGWADGNAVDAAIAERLGFDWGWSSHFGLITGLLPAFERKVLVTFPDGSRQVVNENGVVILEKDGTAGIPPEIEHLLKGRTEWQEYFLPRLQFTAERAVIDQDKLDEFLQRDAPRGIYCGSLYGTIRDWVGMVQLAYLQVDDPALYDEMIETVGELAYQCVKRVLETGVQFDYAHFWEDICFRSGPLVNPRVFREKVGPQYRRVTDLLRCHGFHLVSVDCDGKIDTLVPVWLESGVNIMFPIEVGTWHASIKPWREKYGKEIRGVGGLDKRVFAYDYAAIDAEIERLKPLVELGGYIPCPDHRIAPDAKWKNIQYYCERMGTVFG